MISVRAELSILENTTTLIETAAARMAEKSVKIEKYNGKRPALRKYLL